MKPVTSQRSPLRYLRWLVMCLVLLVVAPPPQPRAQAYDVDLALVLAIDCSFSVDSEEFALQMQGLARAFMSDEVKAAIALGHRQRIAVLALQWSDDDSQAVILPWTIVAGGADADELALRIAGLPRRLGQGGTSISNALIFSAAQFAAAPSAERRVIDVSSDGRNNSGPPVQPVRDRLVAEGIVINGLTIINEWPTLQTYFENNVVGGTGHFVIPANDYEAYGDAILMKLIREITGPGVS